MFKANTPADIYIKGDKEPWSLEYITEFWTCDGYVFLLGKIENTSEEICINMETISAIVYGESAGEETDDDGEPTKVLQIRAR